MHYLGADYSMTSPAIVVDSTDHDAGHLGIFFAKKADEFETTASDGIRLRCVQLPYPEWNTPQERYDRLASALIDLIPDGELTGVIENYAFSRGKKGLVFNMAECTGTFKHELYKRRGVVLTVVPPTRLKMLYGPNGKASKQEMHDSFVESTGIDAAELIGRKSHMAPTNDFVDAWFAARYARDQ